MMYSTEQEPPFDSQAYALAIHTTSTDLGLALGQFSSDRRQQVWTGLGQNASTLLHNYLAEFMRPQTWTDLAFIAVAIGPGGFTGTRLGVVTARTLAQQLNIPLFGRSSLAIVAWQTHTSTVNSQAVNSAINADIAVQMPAHRGKLYGGIYSVDPKLGVNAKLVDTVLDPAQWQETLDRWHHPYQLVQAEGGLGATASSLLELAYLAWQRGERPHWDAVLPFYGQSPV
ncbi:tRNA (adenosine(37)-N6)-threonylcarbamoyltransferase complex dimerization subunit type 1 TsaB [Thermocoleostomius sinensis]|uniref:tRNA (Adenosine(37)-N6)-threonylcarbamoyltransferase complex dimerization subunit type 1 TsaB n=1 Tax=Thermocoleostomius sinensis A174 TaxID=2016057 RepID=A0A9E8ZF31_9CYAN|nr:tRNA (adenosine(37)-N6)-threonylcarbamoyltransferase complex dimerization subunit type 1 TsaB [Thermocoleostomius sinensis]WAL62199.1 tRNA (adenosine(37)-N6)-threonylcarbamoyltransferase complex dimerization subunit type 1 TsaB [Thermocoleostomius sinensis A174]